MVHTQAASRNGIVTKVSQGDVVDCLEDNIGS